MKESGQEVDELELEISVQQPESETGAKTVDTRQLTANQERMQKMNAFKVKQAKKKQKLKKE